MNERHVERAQAVGRHDPQPAQAADGRKPGPNNADGVHRSQRNLLKARRRMLQNERTGTLASRGFALLSRTALLARLDYREGHGCTLRLRSRPRHRMRLRPLRVHRA